MVEIIPAIMPDNYDDLVQKAGRVKGIVPYAQIDVMDGQFVPSVSWPYDTKGKEQFTSMVKEGSMLPFWDEINYEIDLMVLHPENVVEDWIAIGARRIIVHLECECNPRGIIELLKKRFSEEEDFMSVSPVEFGIAFGTETPFDVLTHYMHVIDVVQLMGIKKIGYQGEAFDESVIERVWYLRQEYPHLIISVDGGVNFETAPKLIDAGASRLVSGSAIFGSTDALEVISKLRQS